MLTVNSIRTDYFVEFDKILEINTFIFFRKLQPPVSC